MFAIVEFTCTKEVEIVPDIWITSDDLTWWPNFRSTQRIRKLVKDCIEPNEKGFTQYPSRVLHYYASFDEARANLKRSEEESDLNSGTDKTPKSRKKSQPRQLYKDDSSSESELDVPKRPRLGLVTVDGSVRMPPPPHPLLQSASSVSQPPSIAISTSSRTVSNLNSNNIVSDLAVNKEVPASAGVGSNGFENWMIRNMTILKAQVKTLQESTDVILQRQNEGISSSALATSSRPYFNDLFKLPVRTLASWTELEEKAKELDFRKWLVTKLSRRGGHNVGDCSRRLMSALMADEVSQLFSWKGLRGDKSAFQSSKSKDAIYEAIRDNFKHSAVKDSAIDPFIKEWLKNSKKRLKNKEKKTTEAASTSDNASDSN